MKKQLRIAKELLKKKNEVGPDQNYDFKLTHSRNTTLYALGGGTDIRTNGQNREPINISLHKYIS